MAGLFCFLYLLKKDIRCPRSLVRYLKQEFKCLSSLFNYLKKDIRCLWSLVRYLKKNSKLNIKYIFGVYSILNHKTTGVPLLNSCLMACFFFYKNDICPNLFFIFVQFVYKLIECYFSNL